MQDGDGSQRAGGGHPQWVEGFGDHLWQPRAGKGSCSPGKPKLSEEQQEVEEDGAWGKPDRWEAEGKELLCFGLDFISGRGGLPEGLQELSDQNWHL